jgi:hypothetical protein
MLLYLQVCVWSARKLDKKASTKLTNEAGATGDAARVNKFLMASADAQLKEITRIARKVRDVVDSQTVPWNDAGMRLVSNQTSFSLLGEIGALEQEFTAAVDKFCEDYPQLRAISLQALGDMANEEDYPAVDVVRRKFSMRTTLEPIASTFEDSRTGLTQEQRDQLDAHYAAVHKDRMEEARNAAFDRLTENLERYVDRLSLTDDGKNKVFTHTMVDNLRDTVAMVDGLGLFDNEQLAKLHYDLETKLCPHDAKDLRDSIQTAATARHVAQSALDALRAKSNLPALISPMPGATAPSLPTCEASQAVSTTTAPSIPPAPISVIQPAPLPPR